MMKRMMNSDKAKKVNLMVTIKMKMSTHLFRNQSFHKKMMKLSIKKLTRKNKKNRRVNSSFKTTKTTLKTSQVLSFKLVHLFSNTLMRRVKRARVNLLRTPVK